MGTWGAKSGVVEAEAIKIQEKLELGFEGK